MILYQYRGVLDDDHLQYLQDLLSVGNLNFSKPSKFNDPFDCCPPIMSEAPIGVIPNAVSEAMSRSVQAAISEIHGIACFTPHADSVLMWSHYGADHKSVCVGFDTEKLLKLAPTNSEGNKLYDDFSTVNYDVERPTDEENALYTTKASDWAYEEEVRLISSKKAGTPDWGPGVWCIPVEAICEIVLGARMTKESRRLVVKMAREIRTGIVVRQAVPHSHNFELVIEDFDSQPNVGNGRGTVRGPNRDWIAIDN